VGDWIPGDPSEIVVSEMQNDDYEFLVMIHELVEFYLCKKRGISDEVVSGFDKGFELLRETFPDVIGLQEPGNMVSAPYNKEHLFATIIERMLAQELGVDWQKYDDVVNGL